MVDHFMEPALGGEHPEHTLVEVIAQRLGGNPAVIAARASA